MKVICKILIIRVLMNCIFCDIYEFTKIQSVNVNFSDIKEAILTIDTPCIIGRLKIVDKIATSF